MLKVIHVLGRFNRGGVEVWLKQLNFEAKDDESLQFKFITTHKGEGVFDSEIYRDGGEIVNIVKNDGLLFYFKLFKYFKQERPDVVHSHLLNFSAFVLFIAWLSGIKKRIAHSHSNKDEINSQSSIIRKVYLKTTQILFTLFCTEKIACSTAAGNSLYNSKFIKLENGVNLENFPFKDINECQILKSNFNISNDTLIIGHVGRFSYPKNHEFIVKVASEIVKLNLNRKIKFLLVGDGALKGKIIDLVNENGLQEIVIFIGPRDDVPNLMVNLFDLFLFPSLFEGMPLTLIEAQRANLFSLVSNKIPHDVIVAENLFNVLPINIGVKKWVDEIIAFDKKMVNEIDLTILNVFSIKTCYTRLKEIYNS